MTKERREYQSQAYQGMPASGGFLVPPDPLDLQCLTKIVQVCLDQRVLRDLVVSKEKRE